MELRLQQETISKKVPYHLLQLVLLFSKPEHSFSNTEILKRLRLRVLFSSLVSKQIFLSLF